MNCASLVLVSDHMEPDKSGLVPVFKSTIRKQTNNLYPSKYFPNRQLKDDGQEPIIGRPLLVQDTRVISTSKWVLPTQVRLLDLLSRATLMSTIFGRYRVLLRLYSYNKARIRISAQKACQVHLPYQVLEI